MNQRRVFLWPTVVQLILVLVSAVILLSCKSGSGSGVDVTEDIVGTDFVVSLDNRSRNALTIHDRLLGMSDEAPIKVEVSNKKGVVIRPCKYIDYVHKGDSISVPSGGIGVVRVPVSAVSLSHCLNKNEAYKIRFSLVIDDAIVARGGWASFRADWMD